MWQVVERIEDKDGAVRRSAAQWARSKLDPNLLGKHASAIAGGLDDPILSVRRASLEALSLMDPGILAKYAHAPPRMHAERDCVLAPPACREREREMARTHTPHTRHARAPPVILCASSRLGFFGKTTILRWFHNWSRRAGAEPNAHRDIS